jgi:8-oxo-dGTP pyrophosphatase MutT (NUDIX family)
MSARVFEVRELDFTLGAYEWPFAREREEEIAKHWRRRRAQKPALYDGRVLLMSKLEILTRDDGELKLSGAYFETAYSSFLAWRDFGAPTAGAYNCFSMAALKSADGAFLLGEMAEHTANGGRIYFAAGTPDPTDVFEGRVDLLASAKRELEEETGIFADETQFDGGWTVVYAPPLIACMKVMRVIESAEALQARIHAFLAGEKTPELSRMHIVRSVGDIDAARMPRFVTDFLQYAFDESRQRACGKTGASGGD